MEKEYKLKNKTLKVVVWTKGKEEGYTYKVNFICNGKNYFFLYKDDHDFNRCLGCVEDLIDDCTLSILEDAYDFIKYNKFEDFIKKFNTSKYDYNKCRKIYYKIRNVLNINNIVELINFIKYY